MCLERQTGFSIIAAIFLLVVLALLGALIASVTGMQQQSGQLDLQGVRAYQAARAGSLSGFTVSVTCVQAADTTEGNRNVRVFQVVATACNEPSGGSCPRASPSSSYVERQLQA